MRKADKLGLKMISIEGTLEAGEAQGTQRAIRARTVGASFGPLMFAISLVIGAASGVGTAAFFDGVVGMPNLAWPAFAAVAVLVALVVNRLCRKWAVRRFRGNMQARNMPTSFSYSFSLADDQLSLDTEWMRKIAPWTSVSEIIRSGKYWIFLVGFDPWFAPSRFFSNAGDERDFIAWAVSHLSAEARGRSQDAVAFASDERPVASQA